MTATTPEALYGSSPLATGHEGELHSRMHGHTLGTEENVLAYGADKTGVEDSTANINAAIAATAEGGRLFFPSGTYKFSTLVLEKGITLRGDGWFNNINAEFGHAQWSTLTTGYGGTVLKSTATSGRAIWAATAGQRYKFRDLMLLGPGTGDSNGIEIGTAAIGITNPCISEVLVANFGGTGYRFYFTQEAMLTAPSSRANRIGFRFSDASNNNWTVGAEVQFSDTYGIILDTATSSNHFYGGLIQNSTGYGIHTAGNNHCFDGFYCENPGILKAVLFNAGDLHSLSNSYMSTADDDIHIASASGCLVRNIKGGVGFDITLGSNFNTLMQVGYSTISNSGVNNLRIGTQGVPLTLDSWMMKDGYIQASEVTAPASPGAGSNNVRIYAEDSGGGKTRLMAIFPTGAAQQIAIEP